MDTETLAEMEKKREKELKEVLKKEEKNPAHFCLNCPKYLGFHGFCSQKCHDEFHDAQISTLSNVKINKGYEKAKKGLKKLREFK